MRRGITRQRRIRLWISGGGVEAQAGTILPHISTKAETNVLLRLYTLVQNVVKLVLEGRFRAPHEFKLAKVLKTHETVGKIIHFFAYLGYCMTESETKERRRMSET